MRNTPINTRNINSHVLRQSAIKAFRDFSTLSGNCRMNIEQIDDGGQYVGPGFVDVPYVFTEGSAANGRTGFIYMLQEHYIPAGRNRYFLLDTGRYFGADDDDAVLDTVTYIHGLVRLRVKFLFMQIALPCMHRIVFLSSRDLYFATTTTNATGTRFGRTQLWLQRGRSSTGQNGGYGMIGGGRPPGFGAHSITFLEYFVIACPSDTGLFGNITVPGLSESCVASNNVRAVWCGNRNLNVGYDYCVTAGAGLAFSTFNTPGNAVTMYSIDEHVGDGGASCASNPTSNRMVVCGGTKLVGIGTYEIISRSDGAGSVLYDFVESGFGDVSTIQYKDMSNSGYLQVFGSLEYTPFVRNILITMTLEDYTKWINLAEDAPTVPQAAGGSRSGETSYQFTASNGSGDRAVFGHKYFTMGTLSNAVLIPNGGGGGVSSRAASDGHEGRALSTTYWDDSDNVNPYTRYTAEWYLYEREHPWYLYVPSPDAEVWITNINTLATCVKFCDLPNDAVTLYGWNGDSSVTAIGAASDTWN